MNNSSYLKRCPMCGSRARLQKTSLVGMYAVVCDCSSHIFYGCGYDKIKTAAAWNKRIGEPIKVIDCAKHSEVTPAYIQLEDYLKELENE